MSGTTLVGVGQGVGPLQKKAPFFVRAPPPGPLRRGVVPLTGYRGMSHALFFRLLESSNPRPKGHTEMGSTLTTNWASSSVGSESAAMTPQPGGPLTTRQLAEYKWMSGYPTPLQKIGQSLLCTGSSTQIQNMYTPAFTCPKQSNVCNIYPNMSKIASWAHKPILIKSIIITILQLSLNNSIVDYTFTQTYINIYKSITCYVQKASKS